jgi:hypothetical protein
MNVKELRELLSDVPEEMTQEQFDELDVNYSVDGFNFESPCGCESGLVSFEGTCTQDGVLIPSDGAPETITMFILMPHGITEKLEKEGAIKTEPSLN